MRPTDIIVLQIFDGVNWIDYTDGLLTANIIRGVQQYTGPLTQPDVGQLVLTSRNPNLDPYTNPDIAYNSLIRINASGTRIYTGRIEGINVDYRPRNEDTVVTINAIDMMGTLNKNTLADVFIDERLNWSTINLINDLTSTQEVAGFYGSVVSTDGIGYATGPIEPNTIAYDALIKRVKTDVGFIFADARNEIEYYRFNSTSPSHPYNNRPVEITFDYSGSGSSYSAINLNDGFERIINDIVLNGTSGESVAQITSTSNDSVAVWGKAAASVDLATVNTTHMQEISNAILDEMSEPIREIYGISYDGTLVENAHDVELFDNVRIIHKINESTTLNRKYSVIGIKHEITPENWTVSYVVRNFDYQSTSLPNPVITVTPTSGTNTTDFVFSYSFNQPAVISSILWNLDDGITSTSTNPVVNYVASGLKTIILTLTTIYGYTKVQSITLPVASGPPTANFTYTLDANNYYHFTYTGEEATSWAWDFGDGNTSTVQNPVHYYLSSATRSIRLDVSNNFGTASETKVVNTVGLIKIPVRYVRLRYGSWGTNWQRDKPPVDPTLKKYIQRMDIYVDSVKLNANEWELDSFKEYTGFLEDTTSALFDTYNRRWKVQENNIKPVFDTPSGEYDGLLYPNYFGTAQDATKISMTMVFDLLEPTFAFNGIRFQKTNIAYGTDAVIYVDVSMDGVTWYANGTCNFNNTNYYSTTSNATPPEFTLPIVPAINENLDIQYVRVSFNNKNWVVNKMIPVCGDGQVNNGIYDRSDGMPYRYFKYPLNSAFGFGGIDVPRKNGCSISLPLTYNAPNAIIQKAPSGEYVYPSIATLPDFNTINMRAGYNWSSSFGGTGARTFLIDFGQRIQSFTGMSFDFRMARVGLPPVVSTTTPDSTYTIKIEVSSDSLTWFDLGTYPARQPGVATSSGAVKITTTNGLPVTSSSTLSVTQLTSSNDYAPYRLDVTNRSYPFNSENALPAPTAYI
jgi:PKD repeat protein